MQKNAMERAMENGLLPISHAEDLSLVNGGILNEGAVSKALGVKGIHRASEDISTMREVMLSEYYGLPIHIAHVSTKVRWNLSVRRKPGALWSPARPHPTILP